MSRCFLELEHSQGSWDGYGYLGLGLGIGLGLGLGLGLGIGLGLGLGLGIGLGSSPGMDPSVPRCPKKFVAGLDMHV